MAKRTAQGAAAEPGTSGETTVTAGSAADAAGDITAAGGKTAMPRKKAAVPSPAGKAVAKPAEATRASASTAETTGSPASGDASRQLKLGSVLAGLAPLIAGLAFARAGMVACSYGSYRSTDEGLFTDGSTIVMLLILLIPFAIISATKRELPQKAAERIAQACMVLEALSMAALAALHLAGLDSFAPRFALSALCSLTASGAMFYWLRLMRGVGTIAAVTFVFAALIVSEIELLITAALPPVFALALAGVLALCQLACLPASRERADAFSLARLNEKDAFPGFDEHTLKSRQLLIVMAVSIGLLSAVVGFMRGYPDGAPIPLSMTGHLAYVAIVVVIAFVTVKIASGSRRGLMPAGFFVMLELLCCVALICYAALPESLSVGAALTTALNALMTSLAWYVTIAFMSHGWRDPYYYACAGWFVWLGMRAVTRTAFILIAPVVENQALAIAVASTLVVASTQATLSMLISVSRKSAEEFRQKEGEPSTIVRIMGLDDGGADAGKSLADQRQTSMRRSAEIMGKQFLLSEREIDVLALYALGHTQKKVAEELFITQSTAHEHIKRIYAKTGLHSRQEILDYIAQYAS